MLAHFLTERLLPRGVRIGVKGDQREGVIEVMSRFDTRRMTFRNMVAASAQASSASP